MTFISAETKPQRSSVRTLTSRGRLEQRLAFAIRARERFGAPITDNFRRECEMLRMRRYISVRAEAFERFERCLEQVGIGVIRSARDLLEDLDERGAAFCRDAAMFLEPFLDFTRAPKAAGDERCRVTAREGILCVNAIMRHRTAAIREGPAVQRTVEYKARVLNDGQTLVPATDPFDQLLMKKI